MIYLCVALLVWQIGDGLRLPAAPAEVERVGLMGTAVVLLALFLPIILPTTALGVPDRQTHLWITPVTVLAVLAGARAAAALQPSVPILDRDSGLVQMTQLTVVWTLFMVAWSILWLRSGLIDYAPDPALSALQQARTDVAGADLAWRLLLREAIYAAVVEELIFRYGLLNWLAWRCRHLAHGQTAAVVLTSVLFAAMHYGVVEPAWLKTVQILPLGFLCAWLALRFGLASAIALHLCFNVVACLVF